MTDARKTPEDPVLQHFREHSAGEPPSHLDAFILATAQREVPAPQPNLWQRWVQACQKPRWQVAFASLVGVALMLALVQRTPKQVPSYDFAPQASAPESKKEAAPAPSSVARSLAAPAPAAPMADFAAPAQSESISAEVAEEAKVSKRAAAPVKNLDEQLLEVVRLQNVGQTREADELLATLHKRFPKENLTERLKELKKN
jgi:flagellar motor protein MotB